MEYIYKLYNKCREFILPLVGFNKMTCSECRCVFYSRNKYVNACRDCTSDDSLIYLNDDYKLMKSYLK